MTTETLLEIIDFKKHGLNPVIWQNQEVRLVKCEGGFWVKMPDNSYQKTKNKMLVITEQEAKTCRVDFLVKNSQTAIEERIEVLVKETKKEIDSKYRSIISQMNQILSYAGVANSSGFIGSLIQIDPDYESKSKAAKETADDSFLDLYNKLIFYKKEDKYDDLYVILFQNNLPVLAKFSFGSLAKNVSLLNYLSAPNLEKMTSEIAEKGHLYVVSKLRVLEEDFYNALNSLP